MSISPIQFFRQVKQEIKKVTWPTRKEVVPTCTMVIVLVAIATAALEAQYSLHVAWLSIEAAEQILTISKSGLYFKAMPVQ